MEGTPNGRVERRNSSRHGKELTNSKKLPKEHSSTSVDVAGPRKKFAETLEMKG